MASRGARPEGSHARSADSRFRRFAARAAAGCGLALVALGAGGLAARESLDAREVLRGVQAWLDGTRDLQGGFRQELVSGALGAGPAESGRFWLARPGRMRWEYFEPEHKIAVVDGERTWLYLEEDAQLVLGRLEAEGTLLPRLLAGTERLAEEFHARVRATPRRARGTYQLELTPREGDGAVESIVVLVRPPEFAIQAAEVLDAAGNRVLYRFVDLRRNEGVAGDVFELEVPEGTLVSGDHGDPG